MDIETRIQAMSGAELDRVLSCLSVVLSGSGIGATQAFQFIAEIEAIAIKEYDIRNSGWTPDEELAGYIA